MHNPFLPHIRFITTVREAFRMKYDETQKITALGVVIFSFLSLGICLLIVLAINVLTALLVLKTSLPEGALKVGSVLGSGIGVIASTAFMTAKGRVKGIVSAGIISTIIVLVKVIGNSIMNLGGFFTLAGFAGILIVIIFSLIGAVLGTTLKRG